MTCSIFIFDSEQVQGKALQKLLEKHNHYEVMLFECNREMINQVNQQLPDLVILCQPSHGEKYLRLCGVLHRKGSKSPKTFPILILSHTDEADFAEMALSAGATDVLESGATEQVIEETVESLIASVSVNGAGIQLNKGYQSLPEDHQSKVLVAEDAKLYQLFYQEALKAMGCQIVICENGKRALDELEKGYEPDLILTDINMPVMDGQTLIHHIRQNEKYDKTPIVVSTTIEQMEILNQLFDMGVNDYFTKPVNGKIFRCRLTAHLHTRLMLIREEKLNKQLQDFNNKLDRKVKERTLELYESQMDVIHKLAKASEYKDDDTGNHIHRVGYFTEALALGCGIDKELVEEMRYGSLMHDIGKIGIPDSILQKPGRLTSVEREIMETHTTLGEQILGERPFFKQAVLIAGGHHEKWDGSGYPRKLAGEEIPIAARMVAIVDVFDALLSKRSYKEPKSLEETLGILTKGRGSHFDPDMLDLFFSLVADGTIGKIMERFPYS